MRSVSEYNVHKHFTYEFRESRLKKAAALIGALPAGRMLDVGCTTGDWALHWRGRGWDVAGIDIDRAYVDAARERGLDARLCDLNVEPVPFPDASFDLVFAGEVIEHLVDTDGFLREMGRMVRPGGHLLITTPNLVSFENRVRVLLGFYPAWVDWSLQGPGHVRAYTPRILKRHLGQHGFRVVKHTGNWVPFVPQRLVDDLRAPWLAVTGTLLPGLAMDIIVLARREGA